MEAMSRSAAYLQRGLLASPGAAQTMSKRADRFPASYPVLQSGDGCRVTDVDGRVYVDWICSLGAMTLGYGEPLVTDSVIRQVRRGASFSVLHRREVEVAERLTGMIPCARGGQVRFTKTGSEATAGAIRIARRATGRDRVLSCGYHGWHDPFAVLSPHHPGVPEVFGEVIQSFPYGDREVLASALATGTVAAVILEPTLLTPPPAGWLAWIREATEAVGTVLIFDEMVTGFRWATAGGQGFFGVVPDLATFGKGMANGFALACLAGPESLLRYADVVSGTFGGEAVALAACDAVLDHYEGLETAPEHPIARLWRFGRVFQAFSRRLAGRCPGAVVDGYPVHPRIRFEGPHAQALMTVFLETCLAHGVLLHPAGFNVSASLDPEALAQTEAAVGAGFEAAGRACADGTLPTETVRDAPFTRETT